MDYQTKNFFNPAPASIMYLDINSCFASLEQQANPLLRGVPLVVAASNKPYGCILASSREAKLWGIKTGMLVGDAKNICPFLVTREADPNKYRQVHDTIEGILTKISDAVISKSIDEFVLDFHSFHYSEAKLLDLSREIMLLIKRQVGEWITVSIGLAPNNFLAKLASNLHKSAGLDLINSKNYLEIYDSVSLCDLHGINRRLEKRLKAQGIFTPRDFFYASPTKVKAAFQSVVSYDWYMRLRGWEVDDYQFARKSYGQSYVLPSPMQKPAWSPILAKLVDKAARRMRLSGYAARGVSLYLRFEGSDSSCHSHTQPKAVFTTSELLALTKSLYPQFSLDNPVKHLAVSFFDLLPLSISQLSLIDDVKKSTRLYQAIDKVNDRYGAYSLKLAALLGAGPHVKDAIAFGK
ncbi:MAG: Nucleotidyltransferase/DNA polymerase involved in DNA repair [Microgenomates group bacterium GW2011_GWF2_47_9]|nr:MAG: Nucleotidyltransferase/DNA polymerase involved in DNA repair [Microgenomates group bacterium GW2011_GWF2_47_9]